MSQGRAQIAVGIPQRQSERKIGDVTGRDYAII